MINYYNCNNNNYYCMKMIVAFLCCSLSMISRVKTSRILMVTLAGTKSHKIPFLELGYGLAERGHNLTFINAFPSEQSTHESIEEINPVNLVLYVKNFTNWDLLGPKLRGEMPVPIMDIFKYGYQVCEAFLSDDKVSNLLKVERYDLLILDGAYPECAVGLAYHFKSPFIYINTVGFYTGSLSLAGNPAPYSVTPYIGLPYSDKMNLIQRFVNSIYHIGLSTMHSTMVHYFLNNILQKYINPNIPNAYELSRNVSLILQNGHFSVTYPRPYLPGVVEFACLHCKAAKPLPKDLEEFVNGGEGVGFIYVSMGSSVRASNMPDELRTLFLQVFSLLPYQILWKWESVQMSSMLDLPPNVMLSHWFPQQDLLGHAKIRAFVTHGGLLSLFETVYHAVPVVAMPVFCDHDSNVEKAVIDGYAIRLELREITTSKLIQSITSVINDSRYKMNARKRSMLLRDQLEQPLTRAVYWTEYIMRHKGGHHLQSPAKEMSFLQYYLIDVSLLAVALILLTISIIRLSVKSINRLFSFKYYVKLKIK